jgi:hypothetical protein
MIRSPELFARSCEWAVSLITYTNGYPRATDLDSISHFGDKFVIIEAKRIYKDEMSIPRGQILMFSELHKQLEKSHLFIAGTYSYNMIRPEDLMYFVDFQKIVTKEIPHYYNSNGNMILNVKDMIPISRKGFSVLCNNILK